MSATKDIIMAGYTPLSDNFWHTTLDTASVNDVIYASAYDSSGNVYITGQAGTADTTTPAFIAKVNSLGILQWQRKLDWSPYVDTGTSINLDSSGNIYIIGNTANVGAFIAKYSNSGTIQWQRTITKAPGVYTVYDIIITNTDIYIAGQGYNTVTSKNSAVLIKYNTSGTLQWSKGLSGFSDVSIGRSISIDTTGNIYLAGDYFMSSSVYGVFLSKFNAEGTLLALIKFSVPTSDCVVGKIQVNSIDNSIYLVMTESLVSGYSSTYIIKTDSSLILQWQRKLTKTNSTFNLKSVSTDSAGNVYAAGNLSSNSLGYIYKYSPSGTIIWVRNWYWSGDYQPELYDINCANDTAMYITGSMKVGTIAVISKLPQDGSLQGVATVGTLPITYNSTVTLTDSAGNASVSNNISAWLAKSLTPSGLATPNKFKIIGDTGCILGGYSPTYATSACSRFNSNGSILNSFTMASPPSVFTESTTDSSGNIYISGTGTAKFIAKYTSAGIVVFIRNMTAIGTVRCMGMVTDSSNNVYSLISSAYGASTADTTILIKYDSTGTILWKRTLYLTDRNVSSLKLCIANNNLYIGSNIYTTGTQAPSIGLLTKYNSSGVLQWKVNFTTVMILSDIIVDSFENIYVAGSSSGYLQSYLIKFDNTGAIISTVTTVSYNNYLTIDSLGNIYITGVDLNNYNYIAISKFNSTGTLQFVRNLYVPSKTCTSLGIGMTSTNDIMIGGTLNNDFPGQVGFVAKLPSDGSLMGTLSAGTPNIIYASETATSTAVAGLATTSSSVLEAADTSYSESTYTGGAITYASSGTFSVISVNDNITVSTLTTTEAAGSLTESAGNMTTANLKL